MTKKTAVLVTTEHRGVFFGWADTTTIPDDRNITLTDCRMAIRFGTTDGVLELAESGPTPQSKLSGTAPEASLGGVTMIAAVTDAAVAAWARR